MASTRALLNELAVPVQATSGIRRRITAVFAVACAAVVAFTVIVIRFQLGAVDRGAQVEARDLARSVAYGAELGNEHLQQYVEGLRALYQRDIVIVDAQKRGLADADAAEVGEVFNHDLANEVGQTIQDGQPRLFVERNDKHPAGAKQITVPLHQGADGRGAIVGAVILEYAQDLPGAVGSGGVADLCGRRSWLVVQAVAVLLTCRRDVRSGVPRGLARLVPVRAADVGSQAAPVARDAWQPETGLRGVG